MLANARLYCLLAFFLAFSLSVCLPVLAQVPGVSSSAITFGMNGNMNPAPGTSLSSFGPGGYSNVLQPFLGNCCAFSFLPPAHLSSQPSPPFAAEWRHHRHDDDDLMPVAVPIYIPYAIGYEPDEEGGGQGEASDESADASPGRHQRAKRLSDDSSSGDNSEGSADNEAERRQSGKRLSDDSSSGYNSDESAGNPDTAGNADAEAPEPAPEPIVPQPATVLVYKDGHRADVVNYAIVGDALFDFDDGRTSKILLAELDLAATEKVNDARGVDFKLPAAANIASAPK